MRMLVFTMVGLVALVTSYTVVPLGGPVCASLFLAILVFGVIDRLFHQPPKQSKA